MRIRIPVALLSALAMVVTPLAARAASPLDKLPSTSELSQAIQQGVAVTKVPPTVFPPIGRAYPVKFVKDHPRWHDCFNDTKAATLAAHWFESCAFGDAQGTTVVGVYGDSNAGMWIPALDLIGAQTKTKFLLLSHTGCTTWARPWISPSFRPAYGIDERGCAQWKNNVLSAFKQQGATVVIPISIASEPSSKSVSAATLATSMAKSIGSLRAQGLRPLLLEPIPEFATKSSYLGCVSTHPSNLKSCMILRSSVSRQVVNTAFATVARNQRVTLVPTTDLFCSFATCPLFVRWNATTFGVYLDGRHMNASYAQLISTALQARLSNGLSAAR